MTSRRWSNVTKIVVSATLAVLLIVLLVTFRAMIAPTIVAFLLAFILGYPVNWIQRRTGWPRAATVAVIYLLLLGLLALAPALLYPRGGDLLLALQETLEDLVTFLQAPDAVPILSLGIYQLSLDSLLQSTGDILQRLLLDSTTNPVSIFRGVTTGVLTVLYVLVLSFWILKDMQKLQRLIIDQAPSDYQEELRTLGHELGEVWHAFLRGQLLVAIVVGILTYAALWILGMPNAGGLAVLAAFMEFLPTIGPGISMTIGTVVAFFGGSNWLFPENRLAFALIVLLVYNAITWVESAYLIPRLVGGRVRLHPAVTFVGIINGAIVFGLMGVLLATPVIASVRVILDYIYSKLFDLEPFETPDTASSGVRIRGLIGGRKIEGVLFDLDGTLAQIDFSVTEWMAAKTSWLGVLVNYQRRLAAARVVMIRLESTINFVVSQLWRFDKHATLARFQPLFNSYRGYPTGAELTLQPGVADTLHYLAREYQLAVVSTREREVVNAFLARTCLSDDLFATVITREDVRNLVPNGEALELAAQRLQLEPLHMLVVSDTDPMLRSGAATGMATAGVLCGLERDQDLQSADLVLGTTAELSEWL